MTKQAHMAKLIEILRQEIWRCVAPDDERDMCLAQLEVLKKSVMDALDEVTETKDKD